jgi:Tfp pilus assembly protein PilF
LDFYLKGLKINEKVGLKQPIGDTCHNIGVVYLKQEDYQKGLHYFSRSLKIRQEIGDKEMDPTKTEELKRKRFLKRRLIGILLFLFVLLLVLVLYLKFRVKKQKGNKD